MGAGVGAFLECECGSSIWLQRKLLTAMNYNAGMLHSADCILKSCVGFYSENYLHSNPLQINRRMKFSWHKHEVPDNKLQEKDVAGATVPLAAIIFVFETKDLRDSGHSIQLSPLWAVWFQRDVWNRNTTVALLSKKQYSTEIKCTNSGYPLTSCVTLVKLHESL